MAQEETALICYGNIFTVCFDGMLVFTAIQITLSTIIMITWNGNKFS